MSNQPRRFVFDFDGVLSIPWSQPEKPFEQVPALIRLLHGQGHILTVASYNPRARVAVESWGLAECFHAFRSGANHDWESDGGTYKEEFRVSMKKQGQIRSMHGHEPRSPVFFFDDDPENIKEITDPNIVAVLVKTEVGLTSDLLFNALKNN